MTPSLRKKHRLVWMSFSVILPALFIAAIFNIPKLWHQEQLPLSNPDAFPTILSQEDSENFLLNLRENAVPTKTD